MKKIFSDKRAIVIFLLPAALVYAILRYTPSSCPGTTVYWIGMAWETRSSSD